MKSIKDFANEIRSKYPGSYDDLSDNKLIELWLNKYPNDILKIKNNISSPTNDDDTFREIRNYFFKWIGIVVCLLAAIGFFLNSESLTKMILESDLNHRLNDSSASDFLYTIESFIIDMLIWLKKLPIAAKVTGFIVGGIIWLMNNDE
jgi:hypothetical protein